MSQPLCQWRYHTPAGFSDLLLSGKGRHLTGLWFADSPGAALHPEQGEPCFLPVFARTAAWLDAYFRHQPLPPLPPTAPEGLSPFTRQVLELLSAVPYGTTVTYGDLAKQLAKAAGLSRMSPQAVGGAVGRNPLCILSPCHRVVGANGALTGYHGGLANKRALLQHEGILLPDPSNG